MFGLSVAEATLIVRKRALGKSTFPPLWRVSASSCSVHTGADLKHLISSGTVHGGHAEPCSSGSNSEPEAVKSVGGYKRSLLRLRSRTRWIWALTCALIRADSSDRSVPDVLRGSPEGSSFLILRNDIWYLN